MSLWLASLLALGMVAALFAVAALVERSPLARLGRVRLVAYALGLGVYCTSWTFYGAVGSAVRDGWAYLPIYVGPLLLLLLAPRFLALLSRAVAEEKASTVSDFIAARFGHDVVVARLVTVIALAGTVPYIALQLRSIGAALALASGRDVAVPVMIAAAAVLALFAILFGARRFELSGRSEGLVYAIGLESVIKLVALALVAGLAIYALSESAVAARTAGVQQLASAFRPGPLEHDVPVILVISVMAVLVLPRQFYMALVEAGEAQDLPRARLGFAAYLAVMTLLVLPIALAGVTLLGGNAPPDLYVLALPAALGQPWLLGAALLGGISAASSMVIVDATALATMVSNDLVFPTIIRGAGAAGGGTIGQRLLFTRRVSIVAIVALALAWDLLVSPERSLASIGLVAFAAMAQFTPHLLMAALGGGRDPWAARASLGVGLALWLYTLALPPVLPAPWLAMLAHGALDPVRLFGIDLGSPLSHGVLWSLGANLATLALVNARRFSPPPLARPARWRQRVSNQGDLATLAASFVGEERASQEFPPALRSQPVDRRTAHRAQELIATVVGAAPARALVASALAGGQMALSEVARLLDEGGQSLRFSRQLLAATFENIEAGISVVDAELNLVAWNSRYLELFDYPAGLVRVGVPVADLIRHNARRGDFGPWDRDDLIEHHVEKRLEHLRRRLIHSFERVRPDGRVIKTVGGPMPGGGYVMSFTDTTGEAQARAELERTLEQLEERVAARTAELSEANGQLARATRDKTRFLAAASHDLLQPLHAARLFTAAIERDPGLTAPDLVKRVERSIIAAEDLLRALLDISKLDSGGFQPVPEPIDLAPFLADIVEGIRPLAQDKGLQLRLGPLDGALHTDPGLLRSVLQNFLTNAVRYTPAGGVLLGVRRRGADLRIDVVDSGIGIAPAMHEAVFGEFTRLGEVDAEGLGLGLATAQRIVQLLGGRIELASAQGRGSRFSLVLPAARVPAASPRRRARDKPAVPVLAQGRSLRVLVIDNEPAVVEATCALLAAMGHQPLPARTAREAVALAAAAEGVLADYHLDDGDNGLDLIAALRLARPGLPAALITAERARTVARRAARMEVLLLAKPVAPEALLAFLAEAGADAAEASVLEVEA
jgi:Na+/proline symporter/CheY-like chemotaxis protein